MPPSSTRGLGGARYILAMLALLPATTVVAAEMWPVRAKHIRGRCWDQVSGSHVSMHPKGSLTSCFSTSKRLTVYDFDGRHGHSSDHINWTFRSRRLFFGNHLDEEYDNERTVRASRLRWVRPGELMQRTDDKGVVSVWRYDERMSELNER